MNKWKVFQRFRDNLTSLFSLFCKLKRKEMNTTFKKCTIALLSIVAVLYTSCEDADDNGNIIDPNNSAYDLTETNSEFSILNTALIRTGLDATLDSQGTYTVFCP